MYRYPDFDEINAEKITPTFPVNFGESRLQFSQARYDFFLIFPWTGGIVAQY